MDYVVISLPGCVVVRVFPSIPKIKQKEAEEARGVDEKEKGKKNQSNG
jgi:hypothetical protein